METFFELSVTFGPVILAGMGLYVSVRPPSRTSWSHWAWFAGFLIIGVISAASSFLELKSSEEMQTRLSTQQVDLRGEVLGLRSSVDRLVTGVREINTTKNYQLLTEEQAQNLISALAPFSGSVAKVTINCVANDAMACRLAGQWQHILEVAKWDANNINATISPSADFGVFIRVPDQNTLGAGVLQHAIQSTGLQAIGEISNSMKQNTIEIMFGIYKSSN